MAGAFFGLVFVTFDGIGFRIFGIADPAAILAFGIVVLPFPDAGAGAAEGEDDDAGCVARRSCSGKFKAGPGAGTGGLYATAAASGGCGGNAAFVGRGDAVVVAFFGVVVLGTGAGFEGLAAVAFGVAIGIGVPPLTGVTGVAALIGATGAPGEEAGAGAEEVPEVDPFRSVSEFAIDCISCFRIWLKRIRATFLSLRFIRSATFWKSTEDTLNRYWRCQQIAFLQ